MFNIEQTEEYTALQDIQQMGSLASSALASFTQYSRQAYDTFWYGRVSPVIKMNLLGTKAFQVFKASAEAQAFIKSQNPQHEELAIPEGYEIVWGNDGSAVINVVEIPPVEEKPVEEEVEEII
jgi:hypothetical protein